MAVCTSVAVPAVADGGTTTATAKPTIVLVHGAFADASSWNGVVERLERRGYAVMAPATPLRGLYNDSSPRGLMAVTQRPVATTAFSEKAKVAAWRHLPSWFLVAKQDKTINPDQERFEAKRAGSHTVEIDSSHVAMTSHPEAVTDLILQAATATVRPALDARHGGHP
ncbi:alpha/beta fold hydrolase [Streptomyces sp. NPDC127097]|uniref:alpha/beta fold hydrolase n=1 Tax=Streptomyces sp. NPDC127097 TaxID=3347136 RepID=UPI0036574F76